MNVIQIDDLPITDLEKILQECPDGELTGVLINNADKEEVMEWGEQTLSGPVYVMQVRNSLWITALEEKDILHLQLKYE